MNNMPLTLALRPSRVGKALAIVTHTLAVLAVMLADIPWTLQLMLVIAVVTGLMRLLSRSRQLSLRLAQDGRMEMMFGKSWETVELLPATVVLNWLVVVHCRRAGLRYGKVVPVLHDALDREDFRRLRVWLKWRSKTGLCEA